jgi:hypothetical protein
MGRASDSVHEIVNPEMLEQAFLRRQGAAAGNHTTWNTLSSG